MRLRPVIALVDEETIEQLQPAIDAAVWLITEIQPEMATLIASRGWTAEMVAWGRVLHDLAAQFEITVGPR